MTTRTSSVSIERILVAIELDPDLAVPALATGGRLATAFGAELGVVHVIPPHPSSESAHDPNRLAELVQSALSDTLVTPVTFLDRGDATKGIVERANRFVADLVVVGTHARHGVDRVLMGSVAEHVVRTARCPVLVARKSPAGRILAACDLEATTQSVLLWAKAMSGATAQPVTALHSVELAMSDVALVASTIFGGVVPPQPDERTAQSVREVATGALRSELTAVSLLADAEALEGPPPKMIAARSRELGASMVVVGTHGRKGLGRIVLGSTAEELVRDAPCSVLVVR